MKKVFSLFLCLACFLSVGMFGGCSETDLSGVQSQIDELNATISAMKDRLTAAEGKNIELQNELNQATAKLATLEGKINGEPIKYLNIGETATFVNNGIKNFEITTTHAHINETKYRYARFNLKTENYNKNLALASLTAFLSGTDIDGNEITVLNTRVGENTNLDYPGEYLFAFFDGNITDLVSNPCVLYLFSGANLFAAYQMTFVQS